MFCIHCGKELPDGARFCSFCGSSISTTPVNDNVQETAISEDPVVTETNGQPISVQTQPASQPVNESAEPKKLQVMGLVGFILACASFVIGFLDFCLIATAGMIVSIVALVQFNKNPNKYKLKGFAIAGVAVGAVGCFIMFILMCTTCALTCALLAYPPAVS